MAIRIPIITAFDNKDLKQAGREIEAFSNKAVNQFKLIGIGAVAGLAYSAKAFADFDAALNESVAIMGDVSDVMRKDLADAARAVATSTTFSATEAASAIYFLASAGLDAKASMEALPIVAKFAQAGMFDLQVATDYLTDAQSALGLTIRDDAVANMENMIRVSDVLVDAANLSNASVEQFSKSLTNKAGPAMRAVGMDIESGVAVLAAFADQGIKGEEAGTQFAIVLRDLQTKAIENKQAFIEAGVAVFDSSGEMRNMSDIVGDLEVLLTGMSDEQKKATLATLGFSDKSMGALAALLGLSDAIRGYEDNLREAKGTTEEISNKQLQTFSGQLQILMSQLNDIAIEIGSQLVPALMDMVKYLNTDEGRAKMQELATSLAGVARAVAAVTVFLAENIEFINGIVIALGAVKIAWGVLIATITIYNAATLGAVAVTNALKGAIASTGVGLAIIALGTLVAGFMAADTGAQDAAAGTEDYRLALQGLQQDALGAAGALTLIPASNVNDRDVKPLNPKPGQVYTWHNYSDRDNPGQAVWWTQTWTGTEWTKPKKVTYTEPGAGNSGARGKSAAETMSENRAKLLQEIASYNGELLKLTRLGENTMSEYEQSVASTFEKVRATIESAVDDKVITAKGGTALNKLADITEKSLTRIAKLRAGLADQYEELTEKLNSAKALRESTRDQVTALADLAELSKSTVETVDATGKSIDVTSYSAATLISNLTGVVEGIKGFRDNMTKLREMGLDPQLYQQIIESGMVAGGATAKAIIDGGATSVTEINRLFGELEVVGEELGLGLSQVMYDGGEASIQQLIDGVIAMDEALALQAEETAKVFFEAFQGKVNDSQFDTQLFLNKLRGMSAELNEVATTLGSDFRTQFLAAMGDLSPNAKMPLKGLPTKQELTDYLPPVTVIKENGQAITAVFDEFGKLVRSFTGTTADIGASGLVNEKYFTDYVPIGNAPSNTIINLTVKADDRIGGVKAGELAVEYISKYVDANGSVIKVFGGK